MFVPGRILVIDDVPQEVEEVIDSLRQKGESVLFTTSMPEEDAFFENVRLLIIDLHLAGDRDSSYEAVTAILEKINQKTRFFIIALWTKHARNTDKDRQIVEDLKNLFNKRAEILPEEQKKKYPLKAIFLRPFGKSISQSELFGRIKKAMISHPECGLLFEIERSIESARDRTVSDIVDKAAVPMILKTLEEEVGEAALSREMVDLFLKVLDRHCKPTETMSVCIKKLISQPPNSDADKYGHIHNLQSYYVIPEQEAICTGDVLERKNGKENYAVIVTPECDFAQRKKRPLDYIKIISAIRINHNDFANKSLVKKIKTQLKISKKRTLNECVESILKGNLKERFYVLSCLKDDQGIIFYLILDFQQVSNLPFKEKVAALGEGNWIRVCRVDTPIIDNLLQKYSVYSSRIGIQTIPNDVIQSTIDKIKDN